MKLNIQHVLFACASFHSYGVSLSKVILLESGILLYLSYIRDTCVLPSLVLPEKLELYKAESMRSPELLHRDELLNVQKADGTLTFLCRVSNVRLPPTARLEWLINGDPVTNSSDTSTEHFPTRDELVDFIDHLEKGRDFGTTPSRASLAAALSVNLSAIRWNATGAVLLTCRLDYQSEAPGGSFHSRIANGSMSSDIVLKGAHCYRGLFSFLSKNCEQRSSLISSRRRLYNSVARVEFGRHRFSLIGDARGLSRTSVSRLTQYEWASTHSRWYQRIRCHAGATQVAPFTRPARDTSFVVHGGFASSAHRRDLCRCACTHDGQRARRVRDRVQAAQAPAPFEQRCRRRFFPFLDTSSCTTHQQCRNH